MSCPACGFRQLEYAGTPIVVVDTNVVLDVYSAHDLFEKFDKNYGALGTLAFESPEVMYRLRRARESLLFGILMHRTSATTYSLGTEVVDMLGTLSPPDSARAGNFLSEFTTSVVHFVANYLLGGWVMGFSEGTTPKPEGNAADRVLLDYAKNNSLPLVTNEGYTVNGLESVKLRKLGCSEQVEVLTPREYFAGKIDEHMEIAEFLWRFNVRSEGYLRQWAQRVSVAQGRTLSSAEHDILRENLLTIRGYYRLILLGQVEGRADRIKF